MTPSPEVAPAISNPSPPEFSNEFLASTAADSELSRSGLPGITGWEATIASPSPPDVRSPEQALQRLFSSDPIQASWFVPNFLQQIPLAQIQGVLTKIATRLGDLQSVRATETGYAIRFAKGTVPAQIRLTADGQIMGLFFEPPLIPIPVEEAIAILETSPYTTGVLVTKDGNDIAAINPDMPVAVASAFKLAVLVALKQQIDNGTLSWDTVVELRPEWKSLRSGILQDWPDGSQVTIDTLATLMMFISDNTAADALIQIIGRDSIAALAQRNRPFLTTKEVFTLKDTANTALLKRYQEGNALARQQVLVELGDRPVPDENRLANAPINLEAEWWFTPRELCRLIETVADLPAMQINPGVANRNAWKQIAFKGGSEPGVFNLTTWLQNQQGQTYCVAASWNSTQQPLNEDGLTEVYQGLIIGLEAE
ncbi:MAG: serine hydrolase [Cyanothece sp. SIO2G6]|nr:serine hydrolase [Cyanothece sp. SIO2G6]